MSDFDNIKAVKMMLGIKNIGVISGYDGLNGYGFVTGPDFRHFFSVKDCLGELVQQLEDGVKVSFEVEPTVEGFKLATILKIVS
jgi:cold shock CspA family protein